MLSLLHVSRNIRTIRRYRQIARVLLKYGFDHLLEFLNLAHFAERSRKLLRRKESTINQLSPAVRMRLALEELGPTFIKFGQLLSTRPDVMPLSYLEEFSKLQDQVPSFPFEEVEAQIRREFGCDIATIFPFIDPAPIAAASIAQVHRAALADGEDVVIKVRRPGVVDLVETDIDVLMGLATLAERHLPGSEIYDPVGLVREFARTIRREMDFTREGHTIERMRDNFRDDPTLYFPKVYWEVSSKAVLTLEYIDGIKVDDFPALEQAGLNRQLLARRGADAFLKMVLVHGFFHGDPHPGNVMILPDNIICLLDYGMVGRIDKSVKEYLLDILLAIIKKDIDEVIALLVHSGDILDATNTRALRRDLSEFIDSYYDLPLHEIEVGRMLQEFIEIITIYHIKFQPDLLLLSKALVNIEGMGRKLDPEFDMVEHLRPFVDKAIRERLSPRHMAKEAGTYLLSYFQLAKNLPRDIKEFLNRVNRNKFKIDLEHRGLDRFINELDKSANRLSSSLIIAALIVGSSLIMQTEKGPHLLGFPVIALFGYTIATLIGMYWVIAIIRSGRL